MHLVENQNAELPESEDHQTVYSFDIVGNINRNGASAEPIFVDVKINNQQLAMEVDTGARVSIIPASVFEAKFEKHLLRKSDVRLVTYSNSEWHVMGEFDVEVKYENQIVNSTIIVVQEGKYPLLGRDLLTLIRLNRNETFCVDKVSTPVDDDSFEVFSKFADVFSPELGCIDGFEA